MKLVKFKQYETAVKILENTAPENVSDDVLAESALSMEELLAVNEGIIGDMFGGFFKKLKEKIIKKIPGNVLKKADAIIEDYKNTKNDIYKKIKTERDKIYKLRAESEDDPNNTQLRKKYEEIKSRAETAIKSIESASQSKIDAIHRKLKLMTKDHGDTVRDYIELKMINTQEEIANQELKDAEDFASEKELDALEDVIKKKKEARLAAEKAFQEQLEKEKKDKADKEAKEKEEAAKKNDPANAKVGQVWKTANGNEVEIVTNNIKYPKVTVKNVKSKNESTIKREELVELVKDADVELKKVA
mgnify:FL=1